MSEKEVLQTLLEAANGKITDLTAEVTNLASKLADAQAEVLSMHRRLASESLRADQGWERYENANCDRNSLRAAIAAPVVQVAGGDQHPAWSRMVLYTDTIGGNQTCRDDLWAITSGELRELLAAKVSARAADAPSEPSELNKLMRYSRVFGESMEADAANGTYYLVSDVEALFRAADALDSQPTVPDAVDAQRYRYLRDHGDTEGQPCIWFGSRWYGGSNGVGFSLDDAIDARISSQPTDGEVRNG